MGRSLEAVVLRRVSLTIRSGGASLVAKSATNIETSMILEEEGMVVPLLRRG